MIALLSNGITSEKLHNELSKHIKGTKTAIVVTADNEYKSENYHIPRCIKELNALGLTAQLFDFDTQNAAELLKYDVVYIIGGNRYENFEEKCKQYELDNCCQVIRLNDGEGVLISRGNKKIIRTGEYE